MSGEERTTNVVQRYAQPVNIKLSRSSKGGYYWSIDIRSENKDQGVKLVEEIDWDLRLRFLEQPTPNQPVEATGQNKPGDPNSRMDRALRNIKKAGEKLTAGKGGEKA